MIDSRPFVWAFLLVWLIAIAGIVALIADAFFGPVAVRLPL